MLNSWAAVKIILLIAVASWVGGLIVSATHSTALIWYKLAAAQGFLASQNNLGEMHLNGQGVPVDLTQAYMWFSVASRDCDQDGLDSLAVLEKRMTTE